MSAGDITQPSIVRYASNERADTIDVNALARSVRENIDGLTRTVLHTPRNTNGAVVGTILTGFSLTLNPVPADGKVRVNSELGIALDSNGRYIVKNSGSTIDVTIPAGGGLHQVYAYATEVVGPTAQRRFLPVSSPLTEYGKTMEPTFEGSVSIHVRSGNLASVVREDVVNGRTRSLVLLCIASNTAGTIAITGYNASTAPNGTDIVNRLSAVRLPSDFPTTPFLNPSWRSLDDKINAALYEISRLKWGFSNNFVPSAANNYGAFEPLAAGGADYAARGHTVTTVGRSSLSIHGDVDIDAFPDDSDALEAAVALTPSGGTVLIKAGITVSLGSDVVLPGDKSIRFLGELTRTPTLAATSINMNQFKFVCAISTVNTVLTFERMTLNSSHASANGNFIELHEWWNLVIVDSRLTYSSTFAGAGVHIIRFNPAATLSTTGIFRIVNSHLQYGNADNTGAGGIFSCLPELTEFTAIDSQFSVVVDNQTMNMFNLADCGQAITFDKCTFTSNGAAGTAGVTALRMVGTNSTSFRGRRLRLVRDCAFSGRSSDGTGRNMRAFDFTNMAGVRIVGCDFVDPTSVMTFTTTVTPFDADLTVDNNDVVGCLNTAITIAVTSNNAITDVRITNNRIRSPGQTGTSWIQAQNGTWSRWLIAENQVSDCIYMDLLSSIPGDVYIINNVFVDTSAANQVTGLAIGNTTLQTGRLVIRGNMWRGLRARGASGHEIIHIRGVRICGVDICNNYFDDIHNGAITSAGTRRLMLFQSDVLDTISVNDNTFRNVAYTLSGGSASAIVLCEFSSADMATELASGRSISFCGNRSGDLDGGTSNSGDFIPFVMRFVAICQNLKICENNLNYQRLTGIARSFHDIHISDGATFFNVIVSGNCFAVNNSASSSLHCMFLNSITFRNLHIVNNAWSASLQFTQDFGISFASSTVHMGIFDGNTCTIDTSESTTETMYLTDGTSLSFRPTAFPAAGNQWGGGNYNFYRRV